MKEEGRCPNCGYCKHCGRSDRVEKPLWMSGWRCSCGAWVYPFQYHVCLSTTYPTYPRWTVTGDSFTLASGSVSQ